MNLYSVVRVETEFPENIEKHPFRFLGVLIERIQCDRAFKIADHFNLYQLGNVRAIVVAASLLDSLLRLPVSREGVETPLTHFDTNYHRSVL